MLAAILSLSSYVKFILLFQLNTIRICFLIADAFSLPGNKIAHLSAQSGA